jgi:hypothetical protein
MFSQGHQIAARRARLRENLPLGSALQQEPDELDGGGRICKV